MQHLLLPGHLQYPLRALLFSRQHLKHLQLMEHLLLGHLHYLLLGYLQHLLLQGQLMEHLLLEHLHQLLLRGHLQQLLFPLHLCMRD